MEFLYNYGLFAAKLITVILGLLLIIAAIAGAATRQKRDSEGHLEIEDLNEKYQHLSDTLAEAIESPEAFKKQQKEQQKAEKKAAKAAKKEPEPLKKRLFVLDFDGDVKASEVECLREEISAILLMARPEDEVVVRLESGGGMVHSYGFASSQLQRIKDKEIPLTVIVDKVAASGGYMMACIADRILAGPFAIIGSIGVLAQLPNFHRLLKKHDVDVELHTAGEYKRTLTLFGENTDQGREKFREELEKTHVLFKDFVKSHREVVDIDKVSTGEVWYGKQAVELNLVDGITTSDQYLLEQRESADLYSVQYVIRKRLPQRLGVAAQASVERFFERLLQRWQRGVL